MTRAVLCPPSLSSTVLLHVAVMLLCGIRTGLSQSRVPIALDCLPGWENVGHSCYKLFMNPLPWMSAERTCFGYGGHLATPFDFYENQDMGTFVNNRGVSEFWIGAGRIGVPPNDNRVLYYNGGLEAQMWIGYWAIYQPKFSDGDCVYVSNSKKLLHKWSFGPCEKKTAFLCQRPVCAQGSFHCVNGKCVSPKGKCDGFDDCGDRSDETDCSGSCYFYIRASMNGSITYPGAGLNYPNNADCSWLIEADIGYNLQLTVASLSLENNNDELILMDGGLTESSSKEIVRLTGSPNPTIPQSFYSSDNKMLIKLRSDGSVNFSGFSLNYGLVNPSQSFQNTLVATNMWQELEFPFYNNSVLGNQDLSSVIEAQDAKQTVTVEILDLDLPADASFIVRNGKTESDRILGTYTGSFKGSGIVLSTGRYLYIALHTLRRSQQRGLKIRYMQGCGGSMIQSTGYVFSPGYSVSMYPNSITCNWAVAVPGAKPVTILFTSLDVHVSDKIQIIEGITVIGNYSGNNVQTPVRMNSGQFSVVFTSSATLNSQGFNLTYSVDCPKPVIDLSLSVINGSLNEFYGSSFTVSCKQGSRFSQAEHMNKKSVTMTCNAYGLWNVNTSPNCEAIRCPKAPGLLNGYIASSSGNMTYGGTVTYSCYQGFKLPGSGTITCDTTGQWVNIPTCQASTCGIPPQSDPNGSHNVTLGDGTLFGSVHRYYCNEGYDLVGDSTLFCDSYGTWNGKVGTCKILTCYIRNVPNGVLNSSTVNVGQVVTLTCNPGYRSVTGETNMICNSNRTFTPLLSCQNINECLDNITCQHRCIDTEGSYYCECNPGFEVNAGLCRDINECAANPCNDTCTNTEGSYQCGCRGGYSLFVANGIQGYFFPTSEDGTQPGDVYRLNHSCVRNLCPAPPSIANTDLLSMKTRYYYNDTVIYKCKLGYILENMLAGMLNCNQTGNWTGLEIKCMRAMCIVGQLPSGLINQGNVSPPVTSNMNIGFGEQINITCTVPGFNPQTFSRIRKCTLIGTDYRLDGSINDFECGLISCGKPGDEPGSNYRDLSTFYYNSSFTFACLPSFKLEGASVQRGNSTVTCQSNGQWDFGNLRCTGIQCPDPGQPYLGKQVSSDYREGQLVNFTCLVPGYSLSPPSPISCRSVQTGTYNSSLPVCVDTQPPIIVNCHQSYIVVDRLTSAGSVVPKPLITDNGGIKRLVYSPAWPSRNFYVTENKIFTYTVTDYGNNQASCSITLGKKDDVPPTIICPLPSIKIFRSDDSIYVAFGIGQVAVNDNVTPINQLKVTFSLNNYTFNPKSSPISSFPPTRYEIVHATVEDAAGNSAFCNFGVYFKPDACSPYNLRTPPNANKVCSMVGQGYNCTITCNTGYSLYNNSDVVKSVSQFCSGPGMPFSSGPELKCINLTSLDGSYKLEYDFTYEGKNVSNSCKTSYENIINVTLKDITDTHSLITQHFCESAPISVQGRISLGFLYISEAEKKVHVRYIINFDRRPGSRYSDCADSVKLIMNKPESYEIRLLQYRPLECENITLTANRSLTYDGYYCEDIKNQLVIQSDRRNLSYCIPCPEGTYSNNNQCIPCPVGTYREMPNMVTCTPCQKDTSTYSTGAVSQNECAPECVAGSFSVTGLPPCFQCPTNKYWVNSTTCVNCPPNTYTRGIGAKNQDDCKVECRPGYYNEVDGHAECNVCPMHTYNDKVAAVYCTPCRKDEYTITTGKTNPSDCIKLDLAQCTCLNGVCSIGPLDNVLSCVCNEGWTGENCNEAFDPCASHPCYNNGTCVANGSRYSCSCPAGTSGNKCEQIIKTCTSDYCQNNGMCENLVNTRLCHCLTGFTGDRCQTEQDICSSTPCKNGGNCNSLGNARFSCSCLPGFTGITCEDNKDDCYASPCRNNGTCRDGNMMYTCNCDIAYYTGQNCEERKRLCSTVNCGTDAKCVENEMNYMCVCNELYTEQLPGAMSCKTRDLCARNPCMNNGTCASSMSSLTCMCPFGFTGSLCQHNINDCLVKPCGNGGRCEDLVGGYRCNCTATGFKDERCLVQVDDCASQPCNGTGTTQCQDLVNAYQCLCKPGYTGKNCEIDINECDPHPCLHNATCVNMENNYSCQCPAGWVGKNCETENKMCTPTTCLNQAICYDYFNGYYCKCKPNTFEQNCSASVNVCQVANPCVHGTCQDRNGNAECKCDNGYEGDQCEMQQNFCSVNMSVCMNDGQCIPQLDKYECRCQSGYSSNDCSVPIDSCSRNQCPFGSTCYNTEEKTYCRCPLDKEGPNCDKAWDQDFDLLFDNEHKIGMAYLPYSIKLNSTSFSISTWLQFGKKGGTGTFLSLITVLKPNSLAKKLLHLWIDEKAIYYNSNGAVVNFTHDINYNNDGRWHYLVVNVNRRAGVMYFIVDTVNSPPISISTSDTFYDNIWLVLGAMYDTVTNMPMKDRGFYGKLSRVTVYSRELQLREEITIQGNANVGSLFPDSVLRWSSEWKYSTGVIRKSPSEADRSCPFGYADYPTCSILLPGKMLVTVASGQCSSDILKYTPERLTQVFWQSPTFTGQDSSVSSYITGDTFVWGKYSVVIKASNTDGNTALCLFNIFIQNDNCTNPPKPPNAQELQCSPDIYEKYKQCSMTCMNSTAPSIASPRIYTCGPVGNWDPLNKFVPYRITPCGAISQPIRQLIINLRYSVPTTECTAVTETLKKELRKTQVQLNNEWDRVCMQSVCNDTQINVTCLNKRSRRQSTPSKLDLDVVLTLNDIKETVVSKVDSSMKRTEDLYRDFILAPPPKDIFNYSKLVSDAVPTLISMNNEQMCNPPKVLLENNCVDCGPGTFYNETEIECQFCPVGSYQPLSGQKTCAPCPPAKTTQTTGSYIVTDCYDECPAGQFMNLMTNPIMCTNCSRGLYQPQSGQFSCLACPADKTTKYTGTKLASDCSNDCLPGQEIGSSNNCTDCRIGFYRGPNDAVCQRCPNGTVTQNTSQTSVTACNVADNPAGTKRRQNDSMMFDNCPVGTYQNMSWQNDCFPCDANYLTEKSGSTSITDCKFTCPAGQEKNPKNDSCESCMQAYYRDGSKPFDLCDQCPRNYTTLATGATSNDNCTLYRCEKGEQPNVANNGCEPCPKGFYQEFPDKPKCDPCSANKSTYNTGSTNQAQCDNYCSSGLEKIGGLCRQCPIGYIKDNRDDLFGNCTRCKDSNYVTPNVGSESNANCTVLNCQEGYKANLSIQTCVPCPRGTYQNTKYQPDCFTCPKGTYTRQTNSTRIEDCEISCDSGYENNGTICIRCKRGYYKDNTVDVFMTCKACDIKYVTPEEPPATNASQCTVRNCREGSYIDGDNCTFCANGSYQDKPWQTNCTHCGINRNTEKEGATNSNMCLLSCSAGTENNGVNATCDPCSIGYYKDIDAAAKCTPCANFSNNDILISPGNGSTSVSNCTKLVCLPGYYPVNNKCTLCGYGTYQPDMWRDSCNICPPGNTTYKTGAISLSDCEFSCNLGEGLVNDTCRKCEVGFYNDKSDPSRKNCSQCPNSKITLQEGTTSATLCNITDCSILGQYRDSNDNLCKNCPIGTYQNQIRQDSCKPCLVNYTTRYEKSASVADCKKDCQSGYYLVDTTNTCEPCEKGFYRNKTDGNWDCVRCSGSLTTPGTGSDEASDCSVATCTPGSAYEKANQTCIGCPENTYSEKDGQMWPCPSCPIGQVSGKNSSSSSKCQYPCSSLNNCNIATEVCVNVQSSTRCDCRNEYQQQNGVCTHKCDIQNYCGQRGECIRSPFECKCRDSYTGVLCDIRPDAAAMSDQETETIIIAVVTTLAALLFLILLVVSICVMVRRRRNVKTPRTSEIDEHTSSATRSMKGYDDYPTFAVNPAFSSKPPSVFGGPNGSLPSQGLQMYSNPTYVGDEGHDPAVYRA